MKVFVVLQPGLEPKDVPPETIIAHCEANLARFKVPRYIAYHERLPKTASEKIAKQALMQSTADPRAGCWDRVEGRWR